MKLNKEKLQETILELQKQFDFLNNEIKMLSDSAMVISSKDLESQCKTLAKSMNYGFPRIDTLVSIKKWFDYKCRQGNFAKWHAITKLYGTMRANRCHITYEMFCKFMTTPLY